jgi:hypothetical protein
MVKGWIAFSIEIFVLLIVGLLGYATGYEVGQRSVKQIDKICPEQKAKLITSTHSNIETICVYQEPWKTTGKVKRVKL